jgi:hypothetical protein
MNQQPLTTLQYGVMIRMGLFDNVASVVMDNKIVSSIVTGDGGILYQKTGATSLSINVPLNLVYSDAFSITGYLKDSNNTGLVGETVSLKVGSTIVDSTTTTTGGAYSFTESPVSAGNHSFQVIYAGANDNSPCSSSVVNRTIAKETTILTLSLNKQKYKVGETATATMTLTDDDGTALNNATVSYTIGSTQSTTTTNNNGVATVNFTVQSSVTSISCAYSTTSNYSASSDSESFSIVIPTLLSLSSSTPIIESGTSATVTAVLVDQDGDGVVGETLSYQILCGGIVLDSGSDDTDANGELDIVYTGTGVGDVEVIVSKSSMSLQETYEILDTKWYATDSDVMTWSTSSSGVNTNYNSNHVMNVGETLYIKLQNIPTSVVVGAVDGSSYCQLMKDNNQLKLYWAGSNQNVSGSLSTSTVMKLEIVSSTEQKWYINDTLLKDITSHILNSPKPMIRKYRNDSVTVDYMYIL